MSGSAWARLKATPAISVVFLIGSIFALFFSFPVTVTAAGTMELDLGRNALSARIENSPLKLVVEKIADKYGIWVKGAEHLSNETYSVEFEAVSVRQALERMLSPFNCCYFIDPKGKISGIIIVSKKNRESPVWRRNVRSRGLSGGRRIR